MFQPDCNLGLQIQNRNGKKIYPWLSSEEPKNHMARAKKEVLSWICSIWRLKKVQCKILFYVLYMCSADFLMWVKKCNRRNYLAKFFLIICIDFSTMKSCFVVYFFWVQTTSGKIHNSTYQIQATIYKYKTSFENLFCKS